ncbi:CRISPR-associated endonuclease Cas2 [Pigmentibacter sp. JX0631]|uniref:CRISPR-associated endonuclease Cas2 n=1 Tax=Pigmentibacter sp. JX0631 TaxID=2976982 RepID=UPI0024689F32|nr:CRISPR-associated endonuclease Cas2 [Pigmentibacter sp. JX0631]WGL60035.1 CRISPR-associated endonuclease Cas2 [Pigmentibacter sp. JX0631]
MRVIISYDIATSTDGGTKRLRDISKTMKRFGVRIQKSVFETQLNAGQLQEMYQLALQMIDQKEDSVIFFKLGECCQQKTIHLGKATDPLSDDKFIF